MGALIQFAQCMISYAGKASISAHPRNTGHQSEANISTYQSEITAQTAGQPEIAQVQEQIQKNDITIDYLQAKIADI